LRRKAGTGARATATRRPHPSRAPRGRGALTLPALRAGPCPLPL